MHKLGMKIPNGARHTCASLSVFRSPFFVLHSTFNQGDHYDHDPIFAEMAAPQIEKTCAAESYKAQQEGQTGPSNAAELKAFNRVPGR
jgi:hypothetical protein